MIGGLHHQDGVLLALAGFDRSDAKCAGRKSGIDERVTLGHDVVFAVPGRDIDGPNVGVPICYGPDFGIHLRIDVLDGAHQPRRKCETGRPASPAFLGLIEAKDSKAGRHRRASMRSGCEAEAQTDKN